MCVRNSADPTVKYGCNCPCGYLSLINNLVRSRSTSKLIPVTSNGKLKKSLEENWKRSSAGVGRKWNTSITTLWLDPRSSLEMLLHKHAFAKKHIQLRRPKP